jgi:hypothetical protein
MKFTLHATWNRFIKDLVFKVTLLLIITAAAPTSAGDVDFDSLKATLIVLSLDDEARIGPLIELANFYLFIDPRKAVHRSDSVSRLPRVVHGVRHQQSGRLFRISFSNSSRSLRFFNSRTSSCSGDMDVGFTRTPWRSC